MYHYVWGASPALFSDEATPVDLFTEMWRTIL
jgi:hypothetical protein